MQSVSKGNNPGCSRPASAVVASVCGAGLAFYCANKQWPGYDPPLWLLVLVGLALGFGVFLVALALVTAAYLVQHFSWIG